MGGYQNFLRRMNAGGNTMRNEQIENSLHLVRHTFADDPSYIPEGVQVWNSDRILPRKISFYISGTGSNSNIDS